MNKVFIIEGAQGSGKTTLTRIMREELTYTVLMSLTGTSDKTLEGESKVFKEHLMTLNMIDNCKGCDINFVLDRSFITEKVYCELGYKDYNFGVNYRTLRNFLDHIGSDYEVYVILLTATKEDFEERLKRDKPQFLNVSFNTDNSIRQQEKYISLVKRVAVECSNIRISIIDTSGKDPYNICYDIIESSK